MGAPVVVLIEPQHGRHDHADTLSTAGFHVVSIAGQDASVEGILEERPNLLAAELVPRHSAPLWTLIRRFQERSIRFIPLIVFGNQLGVDDLGAAARSGALWLQLEPTEGARLVTAVKGLVTAARRATPAS